MALSHEENIHTRLSKPANEQINLNKLLRYVSIISPEELYKHCATFDIAYTFQETKFPLKMSILRELDYLEKQSGVHILEPESDVLRAKVVKADLSFNGTAPELNSENIEHYFDYHDHNAKCALVINPENDVKYLTHLKRWSEIVGSEKDFVSINHDPEMVTSMVMKMTSRPKYIRDMTEHFKRAYNLDRGYISVVYDPNYFDTLIKIIVKTAETYSFKTVYLIVEQKYSEEEEIRIYKQLEQRLTRIGVRLLDRKTTREFVQIEYRDCPSERLNDDLEETLNLILQQIALVSSSFIGCAIAETPSHDLVRNMIEERLAYRYHEFDYYMI